MNITKDGKKVPGKRKRTFWDDPEIGKKLDAIPEKERSVNIRMALRQYFGITPGSTPLPDPARDAEQLRSIFQLLAGASRAQK